MEISRALVQNVLGLSFLARIAYVAFASRHVQRVSVVVFHVEEDRWMLMETLSVQVRNAPMLSLQIKMGCAVLPGRRAWRVRLSTISCAVVDQC